MLLWLLLLLLLLVVIVVVGGCCCTPILQLRHGHPVILGAILGSQKANICKYMQIYANICKYMQIYSFKRGRDDSGPEKIKRVPDFSYVINKNKRI